MINLKHVAEGWFNLMRSNLGALPESIKKLAEDRLKICKSCPHRQESRCGVCGCNLDAKTRSPETNCPKGFWIK